jgi:phosphocarrier protein
LSAVSREVEICNRRGLHARASAKFVGMASELPAKVEVEKDGNRVCGTSIMGLMMLGAAMGDTIIIHAEGEEADDALKKLLALVEDRFGED